MKDRDDDAATEQVINDDEEQKLIPFARAYTVFNVEQCEGLDLPELEPKEAMETDRNATSWRKRSWPCRH